MYILVVIITIIFVKESKHKALLQFIKVWSCIKCKHIHFRRIPRFKPCIWHGTVSLTVGVGR